MKTAEKHFEWCGVKFGFPDEHQYATIHQDNNSEYVIITYGNLKSHPQAGQLIQIPYFPLKNGYRTIQESIDDFNRLVNNK